MNLFTAGVSERPALHRPPSYVCVFVCLCVHRGRTFERLQGGQAEVTPHLVCSTAWWEIREQRRRKSERDREGGRGQPVITIVWVMRGGGRKGRSVFGG